MHILLKFLKGGEILKKSESGIWCDYEPFKADNKICPNH